MGTACACPSAAVPVTPRPPPSGRLSSESQPNSHCRFQNIHPMEKENIGEDDEGLLLLQNQLSGRIKEFEQKNGIVSDRFDMFWP